MKTQADKTQESQNSITPRVASEPSDGGTAQLVDNRASTIDQRKLQDTMSISANNESKPIQRKKTPKGSSRFQQIATTMGNNYGVDTSSLVATHNSSLPGKLKAQATIQGNKINFAPGMDSDYNIRHEVAHAIDNTLNGTPKGNHLINGQKVDTTREKTVDRMAKSSIVQQRVDSLKKQNEYQIERNMVKDTEIPIQRHELITEEEKKLIDRGLLFYYSDDKNKKPEKDYYVPDGDIGNIERLSSGAMKRSVKVGNWVLLYSVRPGEEGRKLINEEVRQLLNLGSRGVPIPKLKYMNVKLSGSTAGYIFPIVVSEVELTDLGKINRERNLDYEYKKLINEDAPSEEYTQWVRWGFMEEYLQGLEMPKQQGKIGGFMMEIVRSHKMGVSREKLIEQLISIRKAFAEKSWADFTLIYDKEDDKVTVFDPGPSGLRTNFDVDLVLDLLIDFLNLWMKEHDPFRMPQKGIDY